MSGPRIGDQNKGLYPDWVQILQTITNKYGGLNIKKVSLDGIAESIIKQGNKNVKQEDVYALKHLANRKLRFYKSSNFGRVYQFFSALRNALLLPQHHFQSSAYIAKTYVERLEKSNPSLGQTNN